MEIAGIYFTESGYQVMEKIKEGYGQKVQGYCKCRALKDRCQDSYVEETTAQWAKTHFEKKEALVFVGAMGIAVRSIAGLISGKLEDAPVIVIDDRGQYVIPVLSGHVGGANELARQLAGILGATAVITTATDIHGKFSVDVFAKKNGLQILNPERIVKVSSKILQGKTIVMAVEHPEWVDRESLRNYEDQIQLVGEEDSGKADVVIGNRKRPEQTEALYLKPKEYIVGTGCKKGMDEQKFQTAVMQCLESAGVSREDIFCLASIDVKKEEPAIVELARKWSLEFQTFSAEELQAVDGTFQESEFVAKQVGVGNVCERAAMAAGGETIVLPKTAMDGITVAIAKRKGRLNFEEN